MSKFNYLEYNTSNKNVLLEKFNAVAKEKTTLFVVSNHSDKAKYLRELYNKDLFSIKSDVLKFDEFLNLIFISDKFILRENKRIFLFYSVLTDEQKGFLNINNYFDAIDVANEFYNYYKIFYKKDEVFLEYNTTQIKKIKVFGDIYQNIKIQLDKHNYLPQDWLAKEENLYLDSLLKKYKKIIFYDVIDFPFYFKHIYSELNDKIQVEFFMQVKDGDFDEENFKLKNISFNEKDKQIKFLKYSDDTAMLSEILYNFEAKNTYVSLSNDREKYSLIGYYSDRSYFRDSKLFQMIEILRSIYINIDKRKKYSISVENFKKYVFNPVFMDFYGLDIEDKKCLDELSSEGYKYINKSVIDDNLKIFEDNHNFLIKFDLIMSVVLEIENIKNMKDFNEYVKKNLFNTKENILYFLENYTNIYDLFYEIIAIIESNENMEYFGSYDKFFNRETAVNIIYLLLKYLDNLSLKKDKKENKKVNIAYIDHLKLNYISENDTLNILDIDGRIFYNFKDEFYFLTEKQKAQLDLQTNEEKIKVLNYRFYQNIAAYDKINLFCYIDEEKNIDAADFIYSIVSFYKNNLVKKSLDNTKFMLDFARAYYQDINTDEDENISKEIDIHKELNDFIEDSYKIGAYDYNEICDCELKFYFMKIAALELNETKDIGISRKILGIILHECLEKIIRERYKDFLNDSTSLLMDEEYIRESLRAVFYKNLYKIDSYMTLYIENIFIPHFTKTIKSFFLDAYKEIKTTKLTRFQPEKSIVEKKAFIDEDKKIYLNGRVDLLIETENYKEIIDFKTGSGDKNKMGKQLKFYSLMLFDTQDDIRKSIYNLWENKKDIYDEKKEKEAEKSMQDFKNEVHTTLHDFLNSEKYKLNNNVNKCINCDFKNICLNGGK